MFLSDYFRFTAAVPASVRARVVQTVQATPGITIAELLTVTPVVRAHDLYAMLAAEQIYTDLSAVPLVEHWRVQFYLDQDTHDVYVQLTPRGNQHTHAVQPLLSTTLVTNTKLIWDGRFWTLVNLGEMTTTLLPENGPPIQLPSSFFLQLVSNGAISIPEANSETTITALVQAKMNAASPASMREANRRFPQAVVVDGGKEFHSVYFDSLLARYHCTKKTRVLAKPRFGSVIERLFGTTNTEFIFNLLGNTQASKTPRQLTKDIDPKRLAVWTLADLYTYLMEWAYSIYDQKEHVALGMAPRDAYASGLSRTGEREHRQIPYSEEFLMATYPTTRTGVAIVQPGRGIKLNYLYYWSDAFRNPKVERTKVPIRYDPFDIGIAYAYVEGRWVQCISQCYGTLVGRSEKELQLASQEIRQQGKLTRTTTTISAKHLADFMSDVQAHETLLLQRLRDLEGKQVLEKIASKPFIGEVGTPISKESQAVAIDPTPSEDLSTLWTVDLSRLPVFGEYR